MARAIRNWLLLPLCLFWVLTARAEPAPPVDLHVFWSKGCLHCEKAQAFLDPLLLAYPSLRIHRHEVSQDQQNLELLIRVAKQHQLGEVGVPLFVLGDEVFVGYQDEASTGQRLKSRIEACLQTACTTRLAPMASSVPAAAMLPNAIQFPLLGQIEPQKLSLPVLTVVLAAADGFNPCAMWVLVFLVGLLLGVESRPRRWLLGGTFIVASALVYFLIMAAWLNTLLFLGAVAWIRIVIALVALLAGVGGLRDFYRNEQICMVTAAPAKRAVLERMRRLALSSRLPLALLGITLLALAVNVVELLCSAGIPAVYTQYLALSSLPAWQHYAYLGFYVLVFMADDLMVFAGAMLALEITGLNQRYTRWSKLVGGVVLLVIGILMLLKPEWLM